MSIVSWAVFGLIAGIVAKILMPGRDPGRLHRHYAARCRWRVRWRVSLQFLHRSGLLRRVQPRELPGGGNRRDRPANHLPPDRRRPPCLRAFERGVLTDTSGFRATVAEATAKLPGPGDPLRFCDVVEAWKPPPGTLRPAQARPANTTRAGRTVCRLFRKRRVRQRRGSPSLRTGRRPVRASGRRAPLRELHR